MTTVLHALTARLEPAAAEGFAHPRAGLVAPARRG